MTPVSEAPATRGLAPLIEKEFRLEAKTASAIGREELDEEVRFKVQGCRMR
jgi:hypothetical protein